MLLLPFKESTKDASTTINLSKDQERMFANTALIIKREYRVLKYLQVLSFTFIKLTNLFMNLSRQRNRNDSTNILL